MFIDADARREALHQVETGLFEGSLGTLDAAGLKATHYAGLALLIECGLQAADAAHPTGLAHAPHTSYDESPVTAFSHDLRWTLRAGVLEAIQTPLLDQPAEVTNYIAAHAQGQAVAPRRQLLAGVDTAVGAMTTLLRNVPSLLKAHQIEDVDFADSAKASGVLPWQLAMICINRMLAVQVISSDRTGPNAWNTEEVALNPHFFSARKIDNATAQLRFRRLADISLPTGFKYFDSPYIAPLDTPSSLRELPCHESATIGCPITLIPGAMQKLWERVVDEYDQRDLWVSS